MSNGASATCEVAEGAAMARLTAGSAVCRRVTGTATARDSNNQADIQADNATIVSREGHGVRPPIVRLPH